MAGQGTPARVLLNKRKIAHRVHEYHHDPRTESYGTEAGAGWRSNWPRPTWCG